MPDETFDLLGTAVTVLITLGLLTVFIGTSNIVRGYAVKREVAEQSYVAAIHDAKIKEWISSTHNTAEVAEILNYAERNNLFYKLYFDGGEYSSMEWFIVDADMYAGFLWKVSVTTDAQNRTHLHIEEA